MVRPQGLSDPLVWHCLEGFIPICAHFRVTFSLGHLRRPLQSRSTFARFGPNTEPTQ